MVNLNLDNVFKYTLFFGGYTPIIVLPGETALVWTFQDHPEISEWESFFAESLKEVVVLQLFFFTLPRTFDFNDVKHISWIFCNCKDLKVF